MKWDEIPEIYLYSDGGAEPNPGKGGFGVIMSYKGIKKEFSQGYQLTTNNRMELMGVIYGLEKLKTKSIVNVFTDSRYVVDGITKGWAEKWKSKNWFRTKDKLAVNHDLWERLLNLISHQQDVNFNWIKGHVGHLENERCDELAELALNGENLLPDIGYIPKEDSTNSIDGSKNQGYYFKKTKIEKEGDLCNNCGTELIKKLPKNRKLKPKQTYYFEYSLICPRCKTIYLVEDAKRNIEKKENKLF
jgi:ribonuclease HI